MPHIQLWFRLINDGIHGNILKVIQSMYNNPKSCVLTPAGITELFDCSVGTRQGCMVSPLLYVLYLNEFTTDNV